MVQTHQRLLDPRKKSDQVRDRILDLIRENGLVSGDKLPTEAELVKLFGVGRSSIRSAVQSLIGLGVLEMKPGRGAYVRAASVDDIVRLVEGAVQMDVEAVTKLHEVRTMVEITAARLAAKRRTIEDLAAMRQAIALLIDGHKRGDSQQIGIADDAFHDSIIKATQNKILMAMVSSISQVLQAYNSATGGFAAAVQGQSIITEHEAIYRSIERQHLDAAGRAAFQHMRSVARRIEQLSPPEKLLTTDIEYTELFFGLYSAYENNESTETE